jgi:hypothetical protein
MEMVAGRPNSLCAALTFLFHLCTKALPNPFVIPSVSPHDFQLEIFAQA